VSLALAFVALRVLIRAMLGDSLGVTCFQRRSHWSRRTRSSMAITSLHMNWGTRCPKGSRARGPFCCGCCRPSSWGRPASGCRYVSGARAVLARRAARSSGM